MILSIAELMGEQDRAGLQRAVEQIAFTDGRHTAGPYASPVKRNMQIDLGDPRYQAIHNRLAEILFRNATFFRAVRPRKFARILVSRYDSGMAYGRHFDEAIMGAARTDVSFTIFLSDPAEYDGGELVLETAAGERIFKLAPGAAVVYPSGSLHRVTPVESGSRLVVVGWVQSLVRDPAKREILYDLDSAAEALFQAGGKTEAFDTLTKAAANLLRMWAEL